MGKYLDHLRYRYGLRWPGRIPSLSINARTGLSLAAIFILWGIVGHFDYENELASERARGDLAHKVAILCLPQNEKQVSIAKFINGTLFCEVVENHGYGKAPRILSQADVKAVSPTWVTRK